VALFDNLIESVTAASSLHLPPSCRL